MSSADRDNVLPDHLAILGFDQLKPYKPPYKKGEHVNTDGDVVDLPTDDSSSQTLR